MPRPIRIAVSLFIASTVLIFLAQQRLVRLKESIDAGLTDEAIRNENQMVLLGLIIAGSLAVGGFVLIIVSIAKARKNRLQDHG